MSLKGILIAAGLALFLATGATAQPPIISAREAYEDLRAGDIVMLDIRRPKEWAKTGVAEGAWPVSMHQEDFIRRLQAILEMYPADQIALICATGGRTAHVASVLERAGILGIKDVSESMLGNKRGPGWIARGLPVVSVDAAMQDYEAALQARSGN
jgi:rhodanese-related sulfurtransferase